MDTSSTDPVERLQAIRRLRADGLITDAEYETQRARILAEQQHTSSRILMTTGEAIPGREIVNVLGLVSATGVRGRVGDDARAVGFKEILGGGVTEALSDVSELVLDEARDKALARIEAAASERGADAIVALRMTTVSHVTGGAQALVYGTAVTLAG